MLTKIDIVNLISKGVFVRFSLISWSWEIGHQFSLLLILYTVVE